MTPSQFFRAISWFAAAVATCMVVLALMEIASGQIAAAIILLLLALVNGFGWRTFRTWSRKM